MQISSGKPLMVATAWVNDQSRILGVNQELSLSDRSRAGSADLGFQRRDRSQNQDPTQRFPVACTAAGCPGHPWVSWLPRLEDTNLWGCDGLLQKSRFKPGEIELTGGEMNNCNT